MAVFVRKNLLVCTAIFTDPALDGTQPSVVTAYLTFTNRSGVQETDQVSLSYDSATAQWSGEWDSSVGQAGNVDWMIFGAGALQAAAQGSFQLLANTANTS